MKKKAIKIKTERDLERRLGVKREPDASNIPAQAESSSASVSWQTEKKSLVEKILALKAENQKSLLDLKKAQSECAAISKENQKFKRQLSEDNAKYLVQTNELKSQLANLKTINDKTMNDMKQEKKLLLARIKQYQTGMEKKTLVDKENKKKSYDATNHEYEVESILKHKDTKNGRKYLIRWKGYDSDDDTWESEANLNCPQILSRYIQSVAAK